MSELQEWVPTTEQVRAAFAHHYGRMAAFTDEELPEAVANFRLDFDSWLAEHNRQLAARAWDEGYRDGVRDEARAYGSDQEEPPTPNPYREEGEA